MEGLAVVVGSHEREKTWLFGCAVQAEAQQQALRTPNTHTTTRRTNTTPVIHPPTHTLAHLGIVVEVPQVQAAHAIHSGEHSGVHRRPHDVVHIVSIVLKGVERPVVLRREKGDIYCKCVRNDVKERQSRGLEKITDRVREKKPSEREEEW